MFYNIEAYDEAVSYALAAGKLFDIESSSLYVETIISKCIDEYVAIQTHNLLAREASSKKTVDNRLEEIVQRMFDKCLQNEQYKQVCHFSKIIGASVIVALFLLGKDKRRHLEA